MSVERPRPDPPAGDHTAGGSECAAPASRGTPPRWLPPALAIAALLIALATVTTTGGERVTRNEATPPGNAASTTTGPMSNRDQDRFQESTSRSIDTAIAPVSRPSALPQGLPAQPEAQTDPNDLATYVRPGDPVPTMGELIEALREQGVTTGLAAFNPPGTRPLLRGIVVPPEFPLPPGYVRHHQVTDDGVDVPAILMFAPDAQFFDAAGRPIALPEDGVVPPELVPPGMPIVAVDLPEP